MQEGRARGIWYLHRRREDPLADSRQAGGDVLDWLVCWGRRRRVVSRLLGESSFILVTAGTCSGWAISAWPAASSATMQYRQPHGSTGASGSRFGCSDEEPGPGPFVGRGRGVLASHRRVRVGDGMGGRGSSLFRCRPPWTCACAMSSSTGRSPTRQPGTAPGRSGTWYRCRRNAGSPAGSGVELAVEPVLDVRRDGGRPARRVRRCPRSGQARGGHQALAAHPDVAGRLRAGDDRYRVGVIRYLQELFRITHSTGISNDVCHDHERLGRLIDERARLRDP